MGQFCFFTFRRIYFMFIYLEKIQKRTWTGKFFTERSAHLSRQFELLLQHVNMCIDEYNDRKLRNRRQRFSLKGQKIKIIKRNDKQLPVKHMYTNIHSRFQSTTVTLLSLTFINCIQMSIHQSNSHFDSKIKNRVAPNQGCREDVADFELGSGENPNTFQQQMCI